MDFDVVIVGAGPAGTSAAYRLLANGQRVLLLDRYAFPRQKPCGGGLTLKSLKLMPYSVAEVLERATTGMTIGLRSRKGDLESYFTKGKAICTFAVRSKFDLLNFETVINQGADFEVVRDISAISKTGEGLSIVADGKLIKARYVLGADGANGVVRRLCPSGGSFYRGFALEGLVPYAAIGDEPRAEIFFGVVNHGYGWLFPKGDHVNVGIYTCDDQVALSKNRLRQYCRDRLGTDRIELMVGYPIGFGGDRYRPPAGRLVLIGDAGGFAEPLLGEGLYNALKTGQEAAQAIIDVETSNQPPDHMAARYYERIRHVRVDVRRCRRLAFHLFYPNINRMGAGTLNFSVTKSSLLNGFAAGKTVREITNTFLWSALYRPANPQSLVDFENSRHKLAT